MIASDDRDVTDARRRSGGRWYALAGLGWAAVLVAAVAYLVVVYAPRERQRVVREWQARLGATLDERLRAVEEWIRDGLRGAGHIARKAHENRAAGGDVGEMRHLPSFEATSGEDFVGWWLCRGDGTVLVASPKTGPLVREGADLARATAAARSPRLEMAPADGARLLALFSAVVPETGARDAGEVVVLALDPRSWLYPLLLREPFPTATGETTLSGRFGDHVVFLSPLRHDARPPGALRLPITTPLLPSPLALTGLAADGRYVDYRGQPVLAAARPVGGTRFAITVKVDEDEVLDASRRRLTELLLFVAALLLAVGAGGVAVWRGFRAAHYEALAAGHAEVAELFEHGPDAGLVVVEGRITNANRAAGELFRCPPEALVGMFLWQLCPPDLVDGSSVEAVTRMWISGLGDRAQGRLDWRCRRLDGSEFAAEVSASRLDGTPPRALAWLRDVDEERAVRERLRLLGEGSSRFFVFVQELDGSLSFISPSVEAITGRSQEAWLRQRDWFTTANPINDEARRRTRAHLRGEITAAPIMIEITHASGRPLTLEVDEFGRYSGTRLVGLHGIAHDVTERDRVEQRLAQAQKMEAVGRLAGGIAHDFNNLLQVIASISQAMLDRAADWAFVRGAARDLAIHVRRGASLARQLLLFARRETMHVEALDLNLLLDRGVEVIRRLVDESIDVRLERGVAPLTVRGDPAQLEQVLINLAANAAEAMPEGGALTVRAGDAGDGAVWFEVGDTGSGVPEAIRSRIFEPFFTTKCPGQGTGLGLSVVHGIVAAHNGQILLESELGRGSTLRVRLPRAGGAGPPRPAPDAGAPVRSAVAGARVLVVEDEPAARKSLVDLLGMLGYSVTAVESGEDASRLPAEPPFDVLLTDFRLPGINGAELARGLADRWPGLRVVLMSAYTEDEAVRAAVRTGSIRFLQKPFSIDALASELPAVEWSAPRA